ncbi:MAG: hypothetical protein JSV92_03475 [archaeon]|nr:MAG: hypothetical protein JSV92_03475 [archaeon]
MFHSNEWFEKKVVKGIPIYTFKNHYDYATAIMEVVDDFRHKKYKNMVIDNEKKDKDIIKDFVSLAKEKLEVQKDYFEIGYLKNFTRAKFGFFYISIPLIVTISCHVLNSNENQASFLSVPIMTIAGALLGPYVNKKCMQINAKNWDSDIEYLPLLEEALERPEFGTLNNLEINP